jgi:RNA polymerase sigma-70 factor (ECF subfamily)
MFRITVKKQNEPPATSVFVEGRLMGEKMDQLSSALEAASSGDGAVLVDLAGVSFADQHGLAELKRAERRGAKLVKPSPFLAQVLRGADRDAVAPVATDAQLVARLRAGDADAYETVVRRYGPRLLATAKRLMKSEDEAYDVLQEAYVSAFRGIDRFDEGARLSTWLHRIVVNAALMRLRARRRRPEDSIDDMLPTFDETGHFAESPSEWGDNAESLLERKQSRAMVRAAIAKLPESYRTVLMLRDIEGMDTAEVAESLGMSANAVKVRLHRARQALRTLIERELATAR